MKKFAPVIEPIKNRQFECQQSDYETADKLPFRGVVVSASLGGKYFNSKPCVKDLYWML